MQHIYDTIEPETDLLFHSQQYAITHVHSTLIIPIKFIHSNHLIRLNSIPPHTFSLQHGHSTPQMAGKFAKKLSAKKLILTHFSPRYRGDDQDFSMRIMWKMEHMARKVSDLWGKNDVISAWDQMCLPIRTREDEDAIALKEKAIRDRVDAEAEAEMI